MKITLSIFLLILTACSAKNKLPPLNDNKEFTPDFSAGKPAYIYKTTGDYTNLVPVVLSENKKEIVSYPDPSDIRNGGSYKVPVLLHKGYLLDIQGIEKNTGYLKLTYHEYADLQKAPSLSEMYDLLIDKDPLTQLYDCGNVNAFTNIEAQLNQLIDDDLLQKKCKRIK